MEPERFDVIRSSPHRAVRDAYRRLRARHDRVRLLAPDRLHLLGGTQVPQRTQTFLDTAREHGDGPAEDLVRTSLPGGRESYRTSLEWLSAPERQSGRASGRGRGGEAGGGCAARRWVVTG